MPVKQISLEEFMSSNRRRFGVSDPREKAVIKKPPSYLEATFDCRFEDDRDDLDELKVASFSVDKDLVFLLSLYKHQPDQIGTTLLMERHS